MPDTVSWLDVKHNTWYFMDEPLNNNLYLRFRVHLHSPRYFNSTVNVYIHKDDHIMLTNMNNILKNSPVIEYDYYNGKYIGSSSEIISMATKRPVSINLPLDFEITLKSYDFTPSRRQSITSTSSQESIKKSRTVIIRKQISEHFLTSSTTCESTPQGTVHGPYGIDTYDSDITIYDTRILSGEPGAKTRSRSNTLSKTSTEQIKLPPIIPPLPLTPIAEDKTRTFRSFVPAPLPTTENDEQVRHFSTITTLPSIK